MKRLLLICLLLTAGAWAQAPTHQVSLSWSASPDAAANPSLTYNLYRTTGVCPVDGTFPPSGATATKIASAVAGLSFVDTTVSVAQNYCYAATALLNGNESGYSATAQAAIPLAPPANLHASPK